MLRSFAFAVWTASLFIVVAGAQPAARKEPAYYAGTERVSRVEARPPGIRLGLRQPREFALAPLSGSEAARLAGPGPRLRIGIHRNLPPAALSMGEWQTTAEGTRVWRLALRSPGSVGIRVEFRHFDVGGGRVWLHDGSHFTGPYTGRGIFDNGRFWSATVFSELVILEYEPVAESAGEPALPFEIQTIAHRAKFAPRAGVPFRTGRDAGASGGSTQDASAPDPADYCHLDPNCYPDWVPAMSMVARLAFEDDGDEYSCSGSAIGTRDNSFKPYLLTAGHCIHDEDAARTLEAYWTYQTSACGAPPPASLDSSTKSTLGAHLLEFGTIPQGDYSLVLLQDVPGGVTFSGWDIADPPLGTNLTGIHHPVGSWKRISFGDRVADQEADVEGADAPANDYLQILWNQGRTEPGSSGSPLFSAPGVIVGALTYGEVSPTLSACQIDPSIDGYYRFSNAYPHLKDYLEDLPSVEVVLSRSALSFTVANHAAPPAQTVRLTTQSAGQVTYKLRADAPWIFIPTVSGTLSASAPAQVAVGVDVTQLAQPGQYTGTVTLLSGAAPPRFIDVTVEVRANQSNVSASVSPNPVYQSGGQWSFTIRLSESAGAATRVTALKLNGTDYSSAIASWFGTDHIAANGSIAAPLSGAGTFPPGAQYIEFWGVDDASGQQWYRVATVQFQ
jgi:hypothetical protein